MNASNGVGRVWSYAAAGAPTSQVLLRGRDGGYGDYAGVFTLDLDWDASSSGLDVGFRCAFR